ncbi:MAG: amidohydrolase family protein, partial [Chloroflexota bacterium]
MLAITNGLVYTPTRLIPEGVVLVDGDRIADVGTAAQVRVPSGAARMDAEGQVVCPGLVDIHVHGGDGADATDGTTDAVRALARRHLRAGTTSLIPTTASAPLEQIWQAFEAIRAVQGQRQRGEARVLGIHMEGPFFSLEQRGAHAPELLR